MAMAKIFMTGMSQAVRMPKKYRFTHCSEVYIEKKRNKIILSPKLSSWDDFFMSAEKFPADFLSDRPDNKIPQKRNSVAEL